MTQRAICHLDMDTFFVSVERIKDPSLIGHPVVVGGSPQGRGVVASASYEARLYGIHAAMSMGEAARRCRELIVVRGSFTEYVELSRRVRGILEQQIPVVEAASIDEFYGDLTGTERLFGDPATHVRGVLDAVRSATGLPCSATLAENKLVAKVAIKWAKPNGFWEVPSGAAARQFAPLPISALPGIGPVTQSRLERHGIHTLGELAIASDAHLQLLFGRHGPALAARAQGINDTPVIPSSEAKSLGHETTFAQDIGDPDRLKQVLWDIAAQVGYQLRQDQLMARTLTLKVRWADFSGLTRSLTVPVATNRDYDIARVAEDLFNKVYKTGRLVRLLGIRASGLLLWCEQELLFGTAQQAEERTFYATLDAIRDRFGFGAIGLGRMLGAPTAPVNNGTEREESLFALGSKQAVARVMRS